MKLRTLFLERRLRTIIGMAFLAASCGGPSLTDTSANASEGASSPSVSSQITLTFDVDTGAHKTGKAEGNGTSIAFDFTRMEKNFALEVKTSSGGPLVAYAATSDEYIERVQGKELEIKWSRAVVDARTKENTKEVVAQARQARGDERLLAELAERPEYPLLIVLHRALKTSINAATTSGPSVLPLPGDDQDKGTVCIATCRGDGFSVTECNRRCMGTPPYSCTPQDNTANHVACIAGVDAWGVACILDPIEILEPFLDIGCLLLGLECPSCDSVARQLKDDCPDATICL